MIFQGVTARLVAQGYTQLEDLDFGEIYAPVARLEAIRILLAYACVHNIKLYQMDVKSAFLNSYINEEVYVEQPPGFEDHKKQDNKNVHGSVEQTLCGRDNLGKRGRSKI